MILKDLEPILKSYIIRAIRDSFKRSKVYNECVKKRRVETVVYNKDGSISKRKAVSYKCSLCLLDHKRDNIHVDHKYPVTDIHGSVNNMTIGQYISRVYCAIHNLQVLCTECHKKKTLNENKKRKEVKKARIK